MLGSRGIWHDGWKAVTTHPTISGWSHFNDDTWELYHIDTDRAELHDLAAEHPEKVRELVNLWFAEAGANDAFPLDDRSPVEIILTPRPQLASARDRYVYYPDTAEVPEQQAVNIRNRSFTIGALVDIPATGAQGVLFAQGARFGGHALYIKDNRLHYVNNFVGVMEQKVDGNVDIPVGENLILSVSYAKDGEDPPNVSTGIVSLYHGDQKVGEGRIKTQPGMFSIAGEGLCVGRDSGEPVTGDYPGPHPHTFTGGTINKSLGDGGSGYLQYEDWRRHSVAEAVDPTGLGVEHLVQALDVQPRRAVGRCLVERLSGQRPQFGVGSVRSWSRLGLPSYCRVPSRKCRCSCR